MTPYRFLSVSISSRHNSYLRSGSLTKGLIHPGHRGSRRRRRREDDPRPRLPHSKGRRTPRCLLCKRESTSHSPPCAIPPHKIHNRLSFDSTFVHDLPNRHTRELTRHRAVQAGIASYKPSVLDTTVDEWERMMRVNTTSCFLAIKYAARAMQVPSAAQGKAEGGGSIILTASGASCVVSCVRSHHFECAVVFPEFVRLFHAGKRAVCGITAEPSFLLLFVAEDGTDVGWFHSVAGIRSGAGPVDCERLTLQDLAFYVC